MPANDTLDVVAADPHIFMAIPVPGQVPRPATRHVFARGMALVICPEFSQTGFRHFGEAAMEFTMDEFAHLNSPAILTAILEDTRNLGFPMASEPLAGSLLRLLAATKPGGRFLELGTGTGLSTAWLLDGLDQAATLVSVDVDPEVQAIARRHLGNDHRLNLVTADAAVFLREQRATSFDFIFADAMPGKYEFLDEALALLRPGGLYVIDDMLPQPNWPSGHAPRVPQLLADLADRPEFRLATLAWSSGIAIAVKTT